MKTITDVAIPELPTISYNRLKLQLSPEARRLVFFAEDMLTKSGLCTKRIVCNIGRIIYPPQGTDNTIFGIDGVKYYKNESMKFKNEIPRIFLALDADSLFFKNRMPQETRSDKLSKIIKREFLYPLLEESFQEREFKEPDYFKSEIDNGIFYCILRGEREKDEKHIKVLIHDLSAYRSIFNSGNVRKDIQDRLTTLIQDRETAEKNLVDIQDNLKEQIQSISSIHLLKSYFSQVF
jgi:hypothetical protein